METKQEPAIDRIKLIENHLEKLIEIKRAVAIFFEKKGKQLREIKIFNNIKRTRQNQETQYTIDDNDISAEPVIVEYVPMSVFNEKILALDQKLNGILDIIRDKTVQTEYLEELCEMIKLIKDEINTLNLEGTENRQKIDELRQVVSQVENGVLCFE
jgi:hypothetical protein